jgi:hypothetical protein
MNDQWLRKDLHRREWGGLTSSGKRINRCHEFSDKAIKHVCRTVNLLEKFKVQAEFHEMWIIQRSPNGTASPAANESYGLIKP